MDFTVQNTIQPIAPSSDLQNKIVASVDATAQKADNEKEAKKEAYEAAMGQANIFEQAKNKAYANLKYAQYQSQNGDKSVLNDAQSVYNSACNNFADADINVEVLRSSYLDSIFYAGKMGTCAILANSTLA